MPIHIYNSLTRKKEEFIPINPPQVNIYTCGVTVYDESHIGHARSLYIFDVIRRYLAYRGFQVKFVRNITDIDDKIINRANELKVDWQELVKKYIDRYYEDLKSLGIKKGDFEPRATENIPQMIKYIQGLIEKGFAYTAGGDVYFNVRKFPAYGKLSGQSIDEMETGVRIEPSEHKKDPLDFALWKKSKENEPSWDSPFGKGRPGWHIECSVMSQKFLKAATLDIHAGGRDLIFPHHENEIAQAEALTGKPFAKYWIHHGLLTINGQKMAKSSGNFVTIKDFINKYKYADILKLFFLSAHYSHPIDYNEEKMEEARQALERIIILMDNIERKLSAFSSQLSAKENSEVKALKEKFLKAMDDDFNTAQGLAVIFELVTLANKHLDNPNFIYNAKIALKEMFDIFNLSPKAKKTIRKSATITSDAHIVMEEEYVNLKIREREKARQEENYNLADKIRKELEDKGIILEDTKDGKTTWRRKL
ncbi:MAG: cysteine--tRNA ligase [Candidatus Omnitrophica bacterium CG08_land_8_20_14_0_20_41_16]|uniref:Cysteine--tRNA ligase n=1 Tax=Candidatus Sherwoodlollariibacterium unditelluris TaxID=1974757 RepID=A0A2G9YL94_9BACT|nr:MAG: cysteine--tRNA ligase [Candidatus Omnitrophica bacterium CG23_combo_of_CG06-09_8_20_14_all_41_10]PIS34419.1 MAG: cysteine--tRNA ligase [Candidatus Omnitrophica bacterium CG08_land_8_20_14_0_20_41_16]